MFFQHVFVKCMTYLCNFLRAGRALVLPNFCSSLCVCAVSFADVDGDDEKEEDVLDSVKLGMMRIELDAQCDPAILPKLGAKYVSIRNRFHHLNEQIHQQAELAVRSVMSQS